MNKEIKFSLILDENNIPEKIEWNSSENDNDKEEIKAMMISVWDPKEYVTKKIDLWTKEMYVEEMRTMYFQTLMTMADGLERSTNETEAAKELREFATVFGKKLGVKR